MKTTVDCGPFAAALKRVAPLAPDTPTIPILGTVLLETGPEGLAVTASDLDRWLVERVDVEPRAPWAGCVDAERLAGLAKSLSGGAITLEAEDGLPTVLKLRSGGVAARLRVLPAEDFPHASVPRGEEPAGSFEAGAGELAATLKFCGHAVLGDEGDHRYYLQGVHLGGDGVVVGTDSHRLARRRLAGLSAAEGGVIVPTAACKRLVALLRDTEGIVTVTLAERLAVFAGGQWELTTKLIDGTYPDYRRVLPARSTTPAILDRGDLAAAVERVKLMCHGAGEKSHRMRLSIEAGALTVAGEQANGSVEEVIALTREAPAALVGVNVTYLDKALEVLDSDRVELHLSSPDSAFWLCAAGEEHDGVVLMPRRI